MAFAIKDEPAEALNQLKRALLEMEALELQLQKMPLSPTLPRNHKNQSVSSVGAVGNSSTLGTIKQEKLQEESFKRS